MSLVSSVRRRCLPKDAELVVIPVAGIVPSCKANQNTGCLELTIMKRLALLLGFGPLLLSGCAHQYVMKMTNGVQITTASKPVLKNGMYVYKDAMGNQQTMPAGRVVEIQPASMAKSDKEPYKPTVK